MVQSFAAFMLKIHRDAVLQTCVISRFAGMLQLASRPALADTATPATSDVVNLASPQAAASAPASPPPAADAPLAAAPSPAAPAAPGAAPLAAPSSSSGGAASGAASSSGGVGSAAELRESIRLTEEQVQRLMKEAEAHRARAAKSKGASRFRDLEEVRGNCVAQLRGWFCKSQL